MYRSIILDFLFSNYNTIKEYECYQMTLVLFPSKTKGLSCLFAQEDDITIYHIKSPYTFEKKYAFNYLEGTVVEFLLENPSRQIFNYEDFQFEIKEPYYLKDIREQKFSSVEFIPILANNGLIACAICYAQQKNIHLNISNRKWSTLIDKLQSILDQNYEEDIKKQILANEEIYYIIKNLSQKAYYISSQLQSDAKFMKQIIYANDSEYDKLKKYLTTFKKISNGIVETYYLEKHLLDEITTEQIEIYLFELINYHHFKEHYALLFVKDLDRKSSILDLSKKYLTILKKVIPNSSCKVYKIDQDAIGIVIDHEIKKKVENDLRFLLKKDYFIIINFPQVMSLQTDLEKLSLYLNETLPATFNLNNYKMYCNSQNRQKLEADFVLERKRKIIIKADTLQTIGEVVNPILPDYYNKASYEIFENALINIFDTSLKNNLEKPVFSILTSSFAKRKIYEQLKKIIVKYPDTKLIVHSPLIYNQSVEEVYNTLAKMKELGYIIIIDSSLFMRFEYNICLKLADAILIRKKELNSSLASNNPFNQTLFKTYYEYGKVVIFEEIPSREDSELINELTCLIIDKN